jgi:two-component system, OmpR family, sensor kinase
MKLQRRLKITSALTIASVGVSIGGFAIIRTHQETLKHIDQTLNAVVVSASANQVDPLSEALVATADTDLTLAYVSLNHDIVVVRGTNDIFHSAPSAADLKAAVAHGFTLNSSERVRIRTIDMPDNEFIIVAKSLHALEKQDRSDVNALLLFVLFATACGTLLVGRTVKRDFHEVDALIESATLISQGMTAVQIHPQSGNSEIDQLARALDRMVDSLQSSVKLERDTHDRMQEFLGDASHELRTPLTVIKGYVELLSQDAIGEMAPYDRYLGRVTSEIQRMEALINDLLLLAELGDLRVALAESVSFSEIVKLHAVDLQELEPHRDISLNIEPDVHIAGVGSLIQQLLANLCSNVRRHTPESAAVAIGLVESDGYACLTIDDGGPGLPEGAYDQQTTHFKRFDSSRARESGGSGLGMSIISAIVRQHQGTFEIAQSHLGGLRTVIRLPIADRLGK